ncbi:MAG: SBBP repeat-containing protein [Chitinophagales bacterium]|nr:SBBP repeat-containing protein [Chitinophagales bacterium]
MKKYLFFLVYLIFIIPTNAFCQIVNLDWIYQVGGEGKDIGIFTVIDKYENIINAGVFTAQVNFNPSGAAYLLYAEQSFHDIYIQKLDADRNFIWVKQIGGIEQDMVNRITTDTDGNVYAVGYFTGKADFDPSPDSIYLYGKGAKDAFLLKLDPNGNYLWAKQLGGEGDDNISDLKLDSNDNVYVTGSFDSPSIYSENGVKLFDNKGLSDGFICKFDKNGNLLWYKQHGGSGDDTCAEISINSKDNLLITGFFSETANFNTATNPINYTSNGSDNSDIFIEKLDANGNFLWLRQIGGTYADDGKSITTDEQGNIFVLGRFRSTVDFDLSENEAILQSTYLDYIEDLFVLKLDPNGNFLWVEKFGALTGEIPRQIIADKDGNIYVSAQYWVTFDLNPDGTDYVLLQQIANGNNNFLLKLDSYGNYIWSEYFNVNNFSIYTDYANHLFVTGSFADYISQNAEINNNISLTSIKNSDAFIFRYTDTTSGLDEAIANSLASLYPNPNNGIFTLNFGNKPNALYIYNSLGQEVLHSTSILTRYEFDTRLPKGIYFLKLQFEEKTEVLKLVIH